MAGIIVSNFTEIDAGEDQALVLSGGVHACPMVHPWLASRKHNALFAQGSRDRFKARESFLQFAQDKSYSTLNPELVPSKLCNTCTEADAQLLVRHLAQQPTGPRRDPRAHKRSAVGQCASHLHQNSSRQSCCDRTPGGDAGSDRRAHRWPSWIATTLPSIQNLRSWLKFS